MFAISLLLALPLLPPAPALHPVSDEIYSIAPRADATLETKHYLLYMDGTPEEIALRGRLLEAAWDSYKKFFKGSPKSQRGMKTTVRFYPSKKSWRAGLDSEQEVPPGDRSFVHYSPDRRSIYVYQDRSFEITDKWALYATFLDFHRHLKSKHKDLLNEWYVTGMADSLSTYAWVGNELVLGAHLAMPRNNRALAAVNNGLLSLIEDGTISRDDRDNWEVRWAMSSFLLFGEGGKYRKKFERMALGSRGSMLVGKDLLPSLGDPQTIAAEMVAWVKQQARVLVVDKYGYWQEDGKGITARARGKKRPSFAYAEELTHRLEATIGLDHDNGVGFLIDWIDGDHYTIAMLQGEYLQVQRIADGPPQLLRETRVKRNAEGHCHVVLERYENGITIKADGARPVSVITKGTRIGLAVGYGSSAFANLSWR